MSYWLLDVGLYPCKTCRAIRPPQADQPRRETTDVEQKPPPGPPAPTDRSRSPIPADPPAHPRPSADRWRKAGLRAGAAGRPAHPTLDRPVGTSRTSPWHAGHARSPAGRPSARVRTPDTRLDTVSADQFLLRTPGSGWPAEGHGGPLDRPVGRTSPVQGDRLADGSGPGPDGGGQAADTFSVQRPTMRLASWPRPTMRPAHPGHDRTGRQCACSPSANPSRAGTSASLVPVRCPRGRVRRPRWTP
jgi:hypothetical protein